MAVFDVSFLNKKLRPSNQDYGFLVDQLDIMRNRLESDGKLSPGDYDLLMKEANKAYSHPGLTPQQRSNIQVKISQYQSEKSKVSLKDNNDIARLNREIKDDSAKNIMLFGSNPLQLTQAKSDALRIKLSQLSQSINNLQSAGDDATSHLNEYNSTLQEYSDALQAAEDIKNFKSGSAPSSGFVAYLTTNSRGEITDVEIARTGSRTGYVETNGLYGGLQIYGKVNQKLNGKNVFQIGNTRFSGSDLIVSDPSTPGAFRAAPLLSEDTKAGRNLGVIPGVYKEVDLASVRPQSYIPAGNWAESSDGFLYKALDNGKYQKYVNAKKENLGITDNNLIRIPKSFESGIIPNVQETIDASAVPYTPPQPTPAVFGPSLPTASTTPPAAPALVGAGTSRTPSPLERAPQSAPGIAQRAFQAAGGFLGRLFGRQ